jgi:uncharacterized protein YdaT
MGRNENYRHVVHNPAGGWDVKKPHADRASGHFDNKQDAVQRGREIAQNAGGELVVHNQDGRISERRSYGNDPCPPKDRK